jgi:hypothetical protein
MRFVVTCRRCGHEYEPDRTLIVLGRWRDGCPRCFPPAREGERPSPSPAPAHGRNSPISVSEITRASSTGTVPHPARNRR